MARSDIFVFFAFLLIASGVAVLSVEQADYEDVPVPEPEPADADYDDVPVPEPAEADYDAVPAPEAAVESELDAEPKSYLVNCAGKLTEKCGDDIFGNIFMQLSKLTPECCKKLVLMGKKCHEAMVNYIASSPVFSKNASITVPRSKQVWNKCTLLAEEAPSKTDSIDV